MAVDPEQAVQFEKRGCIAIITFNQPNKLNAMSQDLFFRVATLLHQIAEMDDISITVVTGKGRFFSAGADVSIPRTTDASVANARQMLASTFASGNLHNTHAWYSHPKILVAALNGPAVGISAAFIAHADFIYAAPHAYFAVPFTSLGLVAEAGSSQALVHRLGASKANEALLMSRKLSLEDLKSVGFIYKVIEEGGGDKEKGKGIDTDKFLNAVLADLDDKFGPREDGHLNHSSVLTVKRLIRKPGMDKLELANLDEIWGGLDVFMRGIPQKEFGRIARGEKRHKL